jgi:hypothetical protein
MAHRKGGNGKMESGVFAEQVEALQQGLLRTIQLFFTTRGERFDEQEFTEGSGFDLHEVALQAHFHGARIFPSLEPAMLEAAA